MKFQRVHHFRQALVPLLSLCLAGLAVLLNVRVAQSDTPGKLIATGWDSPDAAAFRKYAAEFEKWPFDGVTIYPTIRRADGTLVTSSFAFSGDRWAADACAGMTADLQASRSRIKAHSFLFCYANPGNVDWFDDAGWTQIVDHWRQLARAAKRSGLRGLLFDAEPYAPPFEQFNDGRQAQSARHTFAEYALKARARGREVMRAVAGEYPDMTLFSYRLLSDLLSVTGKGGDPRAALSGSTYGLLPAFVDGWLDAAPPTLTIIEGNEAIAYRANSPAVFDRAYARLRTEIPALLDSAHSAKYRSQVLISHGLYLDAYANPPGSVWYIDPLGAAPSARLEANLASALRAGDSGYVWVYGETGRWWPTKAGATLYPLWSDKLKGVETALLRAKDPAAAARAFTASTPDAANIISNAAFAPQANGSPAAWWTWQADASHGKLTLENGAVQWSGAMLASLGQNVAVKPGARYALSAQLRRQGRGAVLLNIGWKDAQDRWLDRSEDLFFLPSTAAGSQQWNEAGGIAAAPPGSAVMIVMFVASGQATQQDTAQCRRLRCVPMP